MAQQILQNSAANLIAILTDSSDVPKTGLLFSDVSCSYRKEGAPSLTTKTLTGLNFTEVGGGVYTVGFTSAELNTLGSFVFTISGASIKTFFSENQVVATAPLSSPPSINTCTITGTLCDLSGLPVPNAAVSARVLGMPAIGQGVGFTTELHTAKTDSNGLFSLTLPRLVTVTIYIPSINYTRNLTVPNVTTADLFSEVP